MTELVPGPGMYPIMTTVGTDAPKTSMHATLNFFPHKKENAQKPGPGHYAYDRSSVMKAEAKWKFGSSKRGKNKSIDI
jgi:hypothetical protein